MSAAAPTVDRRELVAPSAVLGMVIFIGCEMMFFAALVSAHGIASSSNTMWLPFTQLWLPLRNTLINMGVLLASGGAMWWAGRNFAVEPQRAQKPLWVALVLGALFVGYQGVEWGALLSQGVTMVSSAQGAFFYLIVGTHALHVVAAWSLCAWVLWKLSRKQLVAARFTAVRILWYFVVAWWPVLYFRVYLEGQLP